MDMVWLNAATEGGSTLYLNIHRIERRGGLFALHGTVGDGFYEGEVLVEMDERAEVTFADRWLDPAALEALFRRSDREEVEAAIAEEAAAILFGGDGLSFGSALRRRAPVYRRDDAHPFEQRSPSQGQLELPIIAEAEERWLA